YAVRAIEEREFRVTVQMNEGHNWKNSVRYWGLRALAAFVALVVLFLALTPMGRYLTRAGWEESKILWRRRAITEIVADTTVARGTRAKLKVVLDARAYARDSLGLKVGKSFTSFSALDHDTLVLVLSAAYKDRL